MKKRLFIMQIFFLFMSISLCKEQSDKFVLPVEKNDLWVDLAMRNIEIYADQVKATKNIFKQVQLKLKIIKIQESLRNFYVASGLYHMLAKFYKDGAAHQKWIKQEEAPVVNTTHPSLIEKIIEIRNYTKTTYIYYHIFPKDKMAGNYPSMSNIVSGYSGVADDFAEYASNAGGEYAKENQKNSLQKIVDRQRFLADTLVQSLYLYGKALEIVEDENEGNDLLKKLINVGNSAIAMYKKAITQAKQISKERVGFLQILLGNIHVLMAPYLSDSSRAKYLVNAWNAYEQSVTNLGSNIEQAKVYLLLGDAYYAYENNTLGVETTSSQQGAQQAYKRSLKICNDVVSSLKDPVKQTLSSKDPVGQTSSPKDSVGQGEAYQIMAIAAFKLSKVFEGNERTKYVLQAIDNEQTAGSFYGANNELKLAADAYYNAAINAISFLKQQKTTWFKKASDLYQQAASKVTDAKEKIHLTAMAAVSSAYTAVNADEQTTFLVQAAQKWVAFGNLYTQDPAQYVQAYQHAYDAYDVIMKTSPTFQRAQDAASVAYALAYALYDGLSTERTEHFLKHIVNMYRTAGKWHMLSFSLGKKETGAISILENAVQAFDNAIQVYKFLNMYVAPKLNVNKHDFYQ